MALGSKFIIPYPSFSPSSDYKTDRKSVIEAGYKRPSPPLKSISLLL